MSVGASAASASATRADGSGNTRRATRHANSGTSNPITSGSVRRAYSFMPASAVTSFVVTRNRGGAVWSDAKGCSNPANEWLPMSRLREVSSIDSDGRAR